MDPSPVASPLAQPYTQAVFTYIFVSFPYFGTLIVLQFLDILSGFLAAFKKGKANSSASWRGMNKKAATWVIILALVIAAREVPGAPVSRVVITWYILSELISILENAGLCGVPLPPGLVRGLQALREFRANADKLTNLGAGGKNGDGNTSVVINMPEPKVVPVPTPTGAQPLVIREIYDSTQPQHDGPNRFEVVGSDEEETRAESAEKNN